MVFYNYVHVDAIQQITSNPFCKDVLRYYKKQPKKSPPRSVHEFMSE